MSALDEFDEDEKTVLAKMASRSSTSSGQDAELRSATDAMQRAAEAMIAATESFRRQFHQQEDTTSGRPVTYHPYTPLPSDENQQPQQPPRQQPPQQQPPQQQPPQQQQQQQQRQTCLHQQRQRQMLDRNSEALSPATTAHESTTIFSYVNGGNSHRDGNHGGGRYGGEYSGATGAHRGGSPIAPDTPYTQPRTPYVHSQHSQQSQHNNHYPPQQAQRQQQMNNNPYTPQPTSRPRTGEPSHSVHSVPALAHHHHQHYHSDPPPPSTTPIPATTSMSTYFLNRPGISVPRINTDSSGHAGTSFGARVLTGSSAAPGYQSREAFVGMTPTTDWPVLTGSTPNLAMTLLSPLPLPPPIPAAVHVSGGSPPPQVYRPPHVSSASASHVDLLEAANRFKASYQDLASVKTGGYQNSGSPLFEDPSPVVRIGRHTYIRSDQDDYQTALISTEHAPGLGSDPVGPHHGPHHQHRHRHRHLHQHSSRSRRRQKPSDRPHGYSLPDEVAFVWLICIAQVLALAGIGQALVPAAIIGRSFPDTQPGDLAWYSAAYGLTAGTFVLPSGRLGDLFGHKRVFVLGFVWFGLSSLACGLAEQVQQGGALGTVYFCVARALQGIGPALLVPNGQAMLGRAYKPGPRKNMVMCLFGAAAPLGFVVGAVMGSLFAMRASWPWAFFVMAAVCVALAAVSVLVMPPTETTRLSRKESLWSQLDGTGMFVGVSGLVLFNFAWNQAPIVSWSTPYVYFILVMGIMLIVAFVYVEGVVAHPLVPVAAMKPSTVYVLACTGTGWACFSIWVFYAVLFLQNVRGWSPILSAAAFAPAPLTGLAASLLTGFLMGRIGPPWIMFISMCAFLAGSVLLATAPVDQSYWLNTFFGILVMPFGMDMSNPAATILLSNSVAKEHQGIAASLVVTVVNYSISIALGFAGTVESSLHKAGRDLLSGYRGAQYFGLGLGGLGVLLAASFLLQARGGGGGRPTSSQPAGSSEKP